MAPTPVHPAEAEACLAGKEPDESTLSEAARLASEAAAPTADRRGSVEYKTNMARVLMSRALRAAVERARGS